jgi:hypothetical protein
LRKETRGRWKPTPGEDKMPPRRTGQPSGWPPGPGRTPARGWRKGRRRGGKETGAGISHLLAAIY